MAKKILDKIFKKPLKNEIEDEKNKFGGGEFRQGAGAVAPDKVEEKPKTEVTPDKTTGFAYTRGGVNAILPMREQAALAAKNTEVGEAQLLQQRQIQQQETQAVEQQLKTLGELTPEQRQRVTGSEGMNVFEGATTLGAAVVGARVGAGAGAKIAGAAGLGVGALGGAALGAFSKLTFADRQDVKVADKVAKQAQTNINWIISNVKDPVLAVQMWNEELANLYAAERNLKALTEGDLKRFLSGGLEERRDLEAYLRILPQLEQQLRLNLLKENVKAQ